jgi:hypothetical protein
MKPARYSIECGMWNLGSTVNMDHQQSNSKNEDCTSDYSIDRFKISSLDKAMNIILSAIKHIGL